MFRKICAILAAVLIIMIIPVIYLKQMNDSTVSEYIESRMVKFTAAAGRNGKITEGDYSGLLREFAATGEICSVSLSHIVPRSILTADSSGDIVKPAPQACGLLLSTDYVEVWQGEKPEIFVFLVYSDDSRVDVTELAESDFDDSETGFQTVTYSYLGFEAYASVFVMKEEYCEICGKRLSPYEISEGCESCRETPVSLIVSPDYLTVFRYEEADFAVVVCYRDGHLELTGEWESNIDTSILGERRITVGYKGLTANAVLNVIEDTSAGNDNSGTPGEGDESGSGNEDGNENGNENGNEGGDEDGSGNPGEDRDPDNGGLPGEQGKDIAEEAENKGAGELADYSECVYSAMIIEKLFSDGEYITDSGYLNIQIGFPTDIKRSSISFGGRM